MNHTTILVPILALALSGAGAATVAAQSYPQNPPAAQPASELTPGQRRMRMLLEGIILTAPQKACQPVRSAPAGPEISIASPASVPVWS